MSRALLAALERLAARGGYAPPRCIIARAKRAHVREVKK